MSSSPASGRACDWHVLVMAKSPQPGQTKTRLCPPLSFEEAADLAEAALIDTLEAVAGCGATRRIVALAGPPGDWIPPGFQVIAQRGGTFAQRLAAAWADAGGRGLQIGMDTPQITPDLLDRCWDVASRPATTAGLGLASDGGWWALALTERPEQDPFDGVPMSTSQTGKAQLLKLRACGHRTRLLPTLRDVDHIDDAIAVASSIPESRFARTFGHLDLAAC